MFSFLTRKKITEEKIANIFVNSLLDLVDNGFPEVAGLINEDSEFQQSPDIGANDSDRFLMIVLAGNLKELPQHFDGYQDMRIAELVYRKMAEVLAVELPTLKKIIMGYQIFCSKVNHPSKNTLYGMSKGVFYKYNLNSCQHDYFKGMNVPNPIFLKRLDEIMSSFVLDWDYLLTRYRIKE